MQSILIQGMTAYWWVALGFTVGIITMALIQMNGPDDPAI